MSKQVKSGWGFSKNNLQIDTTQKVQKKGAAIWQQAQENVLVIPDIEADNVASQQSTNAPVNLVSNKVTDFFSLQIETRKNTLPVPEDGVDLSMLLSMMRTMEQVNELDEPWEFGRLKTEVYELVSRLNQSQPQ